MSYQFSGGFEDLRFPNRLGSNKRPKRLAVCQDWGIDHPLTRYVGKSGLPIVDLDTYDLDHSLLVRLGADRCLNARVLPLRRPAGGTILACGEPDAHRMLKTWPDDGSVSVALADPVIIEKTILKTYERELVRIAEEKREPSESCRNMRKVHVVWLMIVLAGVLGSIALAPEAVFLCATGVALLGLGASCILKFISLCGFVRHSQPIPRKPLGANAPRITPKITILLPLLNEERVAEDLIGSIEALHYPRQFLEVLVLVEAKDALTKVALERTMLPKHFRVIEVPVGRIKTKPRAMNYALAFATGDIVGIYDAEDQPEHDQLLKVATQFAVAPAHVACLQGRLDYFNADANIMARCFTLDYASWFRLFLPALVLFDLPVPLGGTTLFIRRSVLEKLRGWDAHNVTEDAELGMHLYRNGYRVGLLDSTTFEEANCRVLPWIKQRSRWLKGYFITWLMHMRHPRKCLYDMGIKGFVVFQLLMPGTVISCAFAPFLWLFYPGLAGLDHPIFRVAPDGFDQAIIGLLLTATLLTIITFVLGSLSKKHRHLLPWSPFLNLYFLLATFAMWTALWETLRKPHHWHKTEHGFFDAKGRFLKTRRRRS